jgi:hypothetical protein
VNTSERGKLSQCHEAKWVFVSTRNCRRNIVPDHASFAQGTFNWVVDLLFAKDFARVTSGRSAYSRAARAAEPSQPILHS